MTKRNRIIYWVATVWLALGMVSTGLVQMLNMKEEVVYMLEMGYPAYFLTILGVWKMLGIMAILIPGYPLLKEWAYAGFFFVASGAILSHIAVGNPAGELFGPSLLLVLTFVSWYFRPASRKINFMTK